MIYVVTISDDELEQIFEDSTSSEEMTITLYRLLLVKVGLNFDDVDKIEGFPKCTKEFSAKVFEYCIKLDKERNSDAFKGGGWFNSGFSTYYDPEKIPLNGNEIHVNTSNFVMKEQEFVNNIG